MPTAVRATIRTDSFMTAKIGRNDPCPCGSGAKYKHCHGRPASTAPAAAGEDGHAGAVEMALAWLTQRHRKALQAAFDDLLFDVLWPEDGPEPADVDQDAWRMIMTNLGEWLLAEGDIEGARVAHDAIGRLLRAQEDAPRESPSLAPVVQLRRAKGE